MNDREFFYWVSGSISLRSVSPHLIEKIVAQAKGVSACNEYAPFSELIISMQEFDSLRDGLSSVVLMGKYPSPPPPPKPDVNTYKPSYDPDISKLSWREAAETVLTEEQWIAFQKWWSKHPQFNYQTDWQKLMLEAWRESARFNKEK